MQHKVILSFLVYAPRVYSGLDRFDLILAKKMIQQGYTPVFVFADSMDDMPAIQVDLEEAGAIVELIPSRRKWAQTKAVWRLYKKYQPLIVHTHFINYVKLITLFLSSWFGAKHFTTCHSQIGSVSYDEYRTKKGILKAFSLRKFYQLIASKSCRVFTISQMIRKQYVDYAGYDPPQMINLYLGVKTTTSKRGKQVIREELGLSQDAIVLCNISAKEHIKGIDTLLRAFALLKYKNVILVHIGGLRADNTENRAYEQSLYELSQELGVTNRVLWLGRRADIAEIMPAFDIYVHPSRSEGLGMVNMEAAVESLPLVGTRIGGIPEVIHDGENGYLCEVDNEVDLAEKICRLVQDESFREQMEKNSRKILLEEFDVEKQTNKLLNYYLD